MVLCVGIHLRFRCEREAGEGGEDDGCETHIVDWCWMSWYRVVAGLTMISWDRYLHRLTRRKKSLLLQPSHGFMYPTPVITTLYKTPEFA